MYFGFKCEKEIADWLSQKPNRSETIRTALRKQMNYELWQLRANKRQQADNEPIRGTHFITLVSLPKRRGFIQGKRRAIDSLKRVYEGNARKMRVRGGSRDGNLRHFQNRAGVRCLRGCRLRAVQGDHPIEEV